MHIEMQLSRVIINEIGNQQVLYLREVDGDRRLPISIGIFEAAIITRRVRQEPSPRPLTHDLLGKVIEKLGGETQDVLITETKDQTFYARLRIRVQGELLEIDARPSDAIAMAVASDPPLPIYVAQEILDEVLN